MIERHQISLTADQADALDIFTAFLDDKRACTAFVLRGAAGTGKTFLLDLITRHLKKCGWQSLLMAPTGRAAKVMTRRTRRYASTLHRHIYHPVETPGGILFELRENRDEEKVCYIVDEASMLGAKGENSGSGGNLLDDLIEFAYQEKPGRKLIFCGDPAQLPPVGHLSSPALDSAQLRKNYGLNLYEADLNEIMRQSAHSEILVCASGIRSRLGEKTLPKFQSDFSQDVIRLDSADEALEIFTSLYDADNADKVVVITYSNFYATRINQALRARLFETEEPLVRGERLLVVKNNYSHTEKNFPFIANGEPGTVTNVFSDTRETRYGLNWVDALVEFTGLDETTVEVECKIVLDLLNNKQPQLGYAEIQKVLAGRRSETEELPKTRQNATLRKDPYLTALQVKYGYAITGHKAQGGQWQHVIVAFEPIYQGVDLQDYLRWTYTALTRAEEKLYLLGWPFGAEE